MTLVPRESGKVGVQVWDRANRKRVWVGTFDSDEEAVAAEAEADARLNGGPDAMTVRRFAAIWLSDYARAAANTRITYRGALAAVIEAFGDRSLNRVGRLEARQFANANSRNSARVARTMWADALRDEIFVGINPWTNLRLETPRGRKDLDALSEEEVIKLADAAHDFYAHRNRHFALEVRALVIVLGFTGIRPGEAARLRFLDLDLPDFEMTVEHAIDPDPDNETHEKAPKNYEPRTITVPPPAVEVLRALPDTEDGYVWHTMRGKLYSHGTFSYMWRPIKAVWETMGGKADFDLYELRHAAATNFIERGVTSADVALQLGHKDGGRLVEQLYGHPRQQPARDRLKMAFATDPVLQEDRRKRGFAGGFA